MLFKNATIYTMEQEPFVGDFKIDKGVFTEVGKNLTANEGEDVQDLNGLYVFPGLVESHCHLGMEETAIRFEGDDVNEITDPITPNMRGIDGCNPMDETVELALKGGVTTVAAGPGSAILKLIRKEDKVFLDEDKFFKFVKSAFQFKRKNLRNNLKSYDLEKINSVLVKYNHNLQNRAEEISLEEFIDIFKNIEEN